jgi:hypothetical protein
MGINIASILLCCDDTCPSSDLCPKAAELNCACPRSVPSRGVATSLRNRAPRSPHGGEINLCPKSSYLMRCWMMQSARNFLKLTAEATKQLVYAVLETDRSGRGACRGGKCSDTRIPLISYWDARVPPVLVVQLTGVRAPLPLDIEWHTTLYITSPTPVGNRERQAPHQNGDAPHAKREEAIPPATKRKMALRVLVVSRLAFTKEVGYPIGRSFESGTGEAPRYSLRRVAHPDPALKIEVNGKIVRGQAAWLAVGDDSQVADRATAPACSRCTSPDPTGSKVFPATFILYESSSIIIGGKHYHLEIWQDRQTKEWRTRLCGVTVYL